MRKKMIVPITEHTIPLTAIPFDCLFEIAIIPRIREITQGTMPIRIMDEKMPIIPKTKERVLRVLLSFFFI
jgi:hypothetical protein